MPSAADRKQLCCVLKTTELIGVCSDDLV